MEELVTTEEVYIKDLEYVCQVSKTEENQV